MIKRILRYLFVLFAVLSFQKTTAQVSSALNDILKADELATPKYIYSSSEKISSLKRFGDSIQMIVQFSDTSMIISVKEPAFADIHRAQLQNAGNDWKLSAPLAKNIEEGRIHFPLTVFVSRDDQRVKKSLSAETSKVILSSLRSLRTLIGSDGVDFISEVREPHEELQVNNLDLSTNEINTAHARYRQATGSGLVISIKENAMDTTDIDLRGRYIPNPLASTIESSHANIMATMAAGAGNSWYRGLGAAPGADITSSSFSNLFPDPNANYAQYHISVQNHSYGVGVESFYGADAAAFDAAAIANDKLLFVFSAGNSGTQAASSGQYAGIAGFANLTGSFKMAKNIICAGAIDSFYNVAALSSKGPAYDGRVKPELVAYGEDGSSGAAALVSGTALLMQDAYKVDHAGVLPASSLIKAVMLNSCDDVGSPGIDFKSGYGSLNALKAIEGIHEGRFFSGIVSNSGIITFPLNIPAGLSKLKLMISWNDLAAPVNNFRALQNDLDLSLQAAAGGTIYLPSVLSSFASIDSLNKLPVEKRDSLNTNEQIVVNNPAAGNYNITVKGYFVTGNQNFSVAWQFDSANNFRWQFPSATDNIFTASSNVIRWRSTFGAVSGLIEYRTVNDPQWKTVTTIPDLLSGYYRWNAPDTNALALLRITIGANIFLSDTFSISARPLLRVGFNCADSVMLLWNKNKGVSSYLLYTPGPKYLQQQLPVSDTQYVFAKNNFNNKNFAIASVLQNRTGVKSFATDYSTQGVGCFIAAFTADASGDSSALLQLSLGTTYRVSKIIFQKKSGNSFIDLATVNTVNGLYHFFTDRSLHRGVNTFRVAVLLNDGTVIYSNTSDVFFNGNSEIVIYPNPVATGSSLHMKFKSSHARDIILFDAQGRIISQKNAASFEESIAAGALKGFFILRITDKDTKVSESFKVIIL